MNQTEDQLARRIARALDDRSKPLDPAVQEKLAAARRTALAHYREQPAPAWALAPAGAGTREAGHRAQHAFGLRVLVVAAALLGAVAFGWTWRTQNQTDIAEIDAGLLSDELPINAYLDRGFDSWLKRVSR